MIFVSDFSSTKMCSQSTCAEELSPCLLRLALSSSQITKLSADVSIRVSRFVQLFCRPFCQVFLLTHLTHLDGLDVYLIFYLFSQVFHTHLCFLLSPPQQKIYYQFSKLFLVYDFRTSTQCR
jgi:hypothetical protein